MGLWKDLETDPFGVIDRINLKWKDYDFNILHDDHGFRKIAIGFALTSLFFWIVMGFDSTPLQLIHPLYQGLPGLITGQNSWGDLVSIYNSFYGKEMHWSAFVIYLFVFYLMSRSYAKVGVTKTRNVFYSFAVMILAIGLFEWFWILSFGIFQNQPWVYTWQMPQLRILLQNTSYSLVGAVTAFYIWIDSYVLENHEITGRNWLFDWKSWKLWALIAASVASAVLWIYYPGPIMQISVTLKDGSIWHSSRLFPQTLYTVKTDPLSSVNAGEWFYVPNDAVHAMNTIVKAIWALTVYYAFRVKTFVRPQTEKSSSPGIAG